MIRKTGIKHGSIHEYYSLTPYPSGSERTFIHALHSAIKNQVTMLDLLHCLEGIAPIRSSHYRNISSFIYTKKELLTKLTQVFLHFTGSYPCYQAKKIRFITYKDGIDKAVAFELGIKKSYKEVLDMNLGAYANEIFSSLLSTSSNITILREETSFEWKDYGKDPLVFNIEEATKKNRNYRTALWTGGKMQLTVMSIPVGEDIGLEVHLNTDQFLRVEEGEGIVQMGDKKDQLTFERKASDDFAIMVPRGKWHNVTNIGSKPLKLYVIYAPPEHSHSTVEEIKPKS